MRQYLTSIGSALVAFAVIGVIAWAAIYLFFAIVTPGFEGPLFTEKYFSLPLGLAIALRERRHLEYGATRTALSSLALAYIATFCVLVLVVEWVNTAVTSGETLLIHGSVTQKRESHGRGGGGYWIHVQNAALGTEVSLEVPPKEYEKASLGSYFGTCFQVGWLGIPFRWRHGNHGTCTFLYAPPDQPKAPKT